MCIRDSITSAGFYKVINTLSDVKFEANASDFFAISRQAADVLRANYREKVRFLRGYVQNIGFKRTTLELSLIHILGLMESMALWLAIGILYLLYGYLNEQDGKENRRFYLASVMYVAITCV